MVTAWKTDRSLRLTWFLALVMLGLILVIGLLVAERLRPREPFEVIRGGSRYPASTLPFRHEFVGPKPAKRPRILHVDVVDLDGDGANEILACDGLRHQVLLYRSVDGVWEETALGDVELPSPAHATVVDLDQDGRLDVLVAVLGDPWPTDDRVGGVVWLRNEGEGRFTTTYLLEDVRRVTDVQAADLDGDGDLDLAVAEFGFSRGRVVWLENDGEQSFRDHTLLAGPGAIHTPIRDFDGDGDLDIVTVVTQEEEEVWAFENQGVVEGRLRLAPKLLQFDYNFDLGAAGLVAADLDQDGDEDLLMPAGDNLDLLSHYPQPYHGCYWLENQGGWRFKRHRISDLGGAYSVDVGDLDGDGDLDVALVSFCNDWMVDGNASVVWLENNGQQRFTSWQIASQPVSFATVACGDADGDGRVDIVGGSLHIAEPFDRLGRLSVWSTQEKEAER